MGKKKLGVDVTQADLDKVIDLMPYASDGGGYIPNGITLLHNLQTIQADQANITGTIPESIGELKKLTYINLSYNQLTGHIPTSIGKLSKLARLNLSHNKLTGEVPESIMNISKLQIFDLSYNRFLGLLDNIARFISNIPRYDLSSNEFTVLDNENLRLLTQSNQPEPKLGLVDKNFFHPDNRGFYAGRSLLAHYMNLGFEGVIFKNKPNEPLYLFSETEANSLKIGHANSPTVTNDGPKDLSPEHTYTVWDSSGNVIFNGKPDENFSFIPPKTEEAYTVQMDNPNPPRVGKEDDPTDIFASNFLAYNIGFFRLNVSLFSSFSPKDLSNVDPYTHALQGEINKPFTLNAEINGNGKKFYPDIPYTHSYFFSDSIYVTYLKVELKPTLLNKMKIDPDSFTMVGGTPAGIVTPTDGGYYLPINSNVQARADVPSRTLSFDVIPTSLVSLAEGKDGIISTVETIAGKASSKSQTIVVKDGKLEFNAVPPDLNFEAGKISNATVNIGRADPAWKIIVKDTRLKKGAWDVTAKQLTPFTNADNDKLPDSLIYRKKGQQDQIINSTSSVLVYHKATEGDDYYPVSWSQDEGPLLEILPGQAKNFK
ncbi:RHS repeat-associated core domain-containing protein [Listeria floridensis FSL S10-1187]|uniref:RHS repeat-associated core domain-containing protein n=1 Tax=Listeria floridensis FSL S10-1187 TaxID=1265817 RepID=A0ABN0RD39_9LIST|nr:hypothetical protein [Listeria floridensis]EUJ28526.1 RHS repeat-associated core domain-containing protein [Listeria floridensis FSL S10-1187]